MFYEHDASEEIRGIFMEAMARCLGVNKRQLESDPSIVEELGLDSLDLVEMVMEIEEASGGGT